jgi:hypothetical protein
MKTNTSRTILIVALTMVIFTIILIGVSDNRLSYALMTVIGAVDATLVGIIADVKKLEKGEKEGK